MAEGGEAFVLQMGEPMRIRDLARSVIEAQGYAVRDEDHPDGDIEIVTTGLRPGEKLHEELTVSGDRRPTSHPKIFAAHEAKLSPIETAAMLRALTAAIAESDAEGAVAIAARFVEGDLASHVPSIAAPSSGSAPVVAMTPAARREAVVAEWPGRGADASVRVARA